MKKRILMIVIILLMLSFFVIGCSSNDVQIRKGSGLHQEVTGATIVFDYTDDSVNLLDKKNNTG